MPHQYMRHMSFAFMIVCNIAMSICHLFAVILSVFSGVGKVNVGNESNPNTAVYSFYENYPSNYLLINVYITTEDAADTVPPVRSINLIQRCAVLSPEQRIVVG